MPATSGTSARGPWQRQEVVFDLQTNNSQFPRKACVTFFNKPEEVARLKEGDACIVSFDIESREYNGRWYTEAGRGGGSGWICRGANGSSSCTRSSSDANL